MLHKLQYLSSRMLLALELKELILLVTNVYITMVQRTNELSEWIFDRKWK